VGQPLTLVATPYRNEPSHTSCQPVFYDDSPIATEGLWCNSLWSAQWRRSVICLSVCFSHIQYIRWIFSWSQNRPGIRSRRIAYIREFFWAQSGPGIYSNSHRPRYSQPAGARISTGPVSHSLFTVPSPKTVNTTGTGHRQRNQFTVKTTRCLSTTMNQTGL